MTVVLQRFRRMRVKCTTTAATRPTHASRSRSDCVASRSIISSTSSCPAVSSPSCLSSRSDSSPATQNDSVSVRKPPTFSSSSLGDRLLNGSPYAVGPLSVLSCLSCLRNGWIDQDATRYGDRPLASRHCVIWGPSSPFPGRTPIILGA